ncbi:hypothetical protein Taro_021929, partial [Colocasia esculenta]|nr:hypothetical protein [Colocasia esculenta]
MGGGLGNDTEGWLWICVGVQCAGHQQWVGVQVCDVDYVLAAMGSPEPCSFPLSLPSSSPTFTLKPLHEFRWSTGVRGAAVVCVAAANQAGNDELERGVRGAFLGFRRDSRFFGSSIEFL